MLSHLSPYREKLQALGATFLLDKDEHGYGSYPRSERILVGGREITVHPSDRAKGKGHALVPIDVAKFDAAWTRDTGFHIDPTGHNQIPGRRQSVREFLQTTDRMEAPEAVVQADGRAGFTDGRHRMAYLRDAGVKRVPMTMSPESHANARRHGLLATTAQRLSYRESLQAYLLGGAGSGNYGHAGRPGEVGGSAPGESHADKPSVKGQNIRSISDHADDAVVEHVLGLDSEAKVKDLAESMVQYVDKEKFSVEISTEGGGPSHEELKEGYDEYAAHESAAVRREWVTDRTDRQAEIIKIWDQVQEEKRAGPYGDVREHPTLPLGKDEFRPIEHGGVGGKAQISIDDLMKGLDPSSHFSQSERDTITERLRASGGPALESTNMMRHAWQEQHGESFEPHQSFDDWSEGRGSSRGDDEVVRLKFEGNHGTLMTREFKRDANGDLVADHAYFQANSQGGGMAKDVLRASFDEYQKLGVDKVTVHANVDVGGYAWAKFGFRTSEEHGGVDVDQLFRDAERKGRITHEEKQMLEDVATEHEGEDTQLWHIADTTHGDRKIGASVLLGSDWYGEIRLSDKVAMGRLRTYIAETKPSVARAPVPNRQADERAIRSATENVSDAEAWDRAHPTKEDSAERDAQVRQQQKAQRVSYLPQAWDEAHRENAARDELEAAISRRHVAAEAAIAKADTAALTAERNRLIDTARGTAAEEARLREIDTALRQRADAKAVAAERAEQNANRKRLGLTPIHFADDPILPPEPKPGSREMFYEDAHGQRADRDLWRDILGDDFPDDEPEEPPKKALTAADIVSIRVVPRASTHLSYRDKLQGFLLDWDESLHPRDERGRFGETAVGQQIVNHIFDSGIGSDHVGMLYSDDATDAMATNFKLDTVRDADIAYARAEIARQSQALLREKFGDTVVAYRGKTGTEGKTPTTSLSLSPATAKFHAKGRGITRHAVPVSNVLSYSEAVGKGTFAEQEIIVKPSTLSLSYRDKLEFVLAGWEEALHPRDEIGRFAESEGRDFKGNEGYDWFEQGPVADYASTVQYEDANAISSYASFSYGDINKQLRGEFTPNIVNETVRAATPEEIAAFDHPPMGHGQHASDYKDSEPLNKVADGRIVHNFYYEGGYKPDDRAANERNRVDTYTIEKAGPDTKYVKELEAKTDTINAAIRERGYVLPEAMKVNRAAYIPGMSYEDVKNLEGKVIEEKGFTSTMVGNPSNRLDGYVEIGKAESLYKRYGEQAPGAMYQYQNEVGAPLRISITLPEGTKVAPVEAIRRVEHDFPRVQDPEVFKHPEWLTNEDGTPNGLKASDYTKRDYTAKPTIKTRMLQEKDKRTEAEVLLGSGAQFKIKRVQRGEKRIVSNDPKMKPIDVIDVQMEYVGGGSSEGK